MIAMHQWCIVDDNTLALKRLLSLWDDDIYCAFILSHTWEMIWKYEHFSLYIEWSVNDK